MPFSSFPLFTHIHTHTRSFYKKKHCMNKHLSLIHELWKWAQWEFWLWWIFSSMHVLTYALTCSLTINVYCYIKKGKGEENYTWKIPWDHFIFAFLFFLYHLELSCDVSCEKVNNYGGVRVEMRQINCDVKLTRNDWNEGLNWL